MSKLIQSPSKLFLILCLVFGTIMIFLMPAGAGYDEETHLARIYEIDHKSLVPNQWLGEEGNGIPSTMLKLSYRQRSFLLPLTMQDIRDQLTLGIRSEVTIAHLTRATYSPLLYLPQAVLLFLSGYILNLPLLVSYWLIRFSYLLIYAFLCSLAIHLIPKFKWTLLVLSLAPMAMIQATSISIDPTTNGASFLFVAWALFLIEKKQPIRRKEFWISMLLAFLLFSVKPNSTPLVLLLVLLKPSQFSSKKSMWLFWGLIAVLFLVEVGGWTAIQYQSETARRGLSDSETSGLLSILLASPLTFFGGLITYIGTNIPQTLKDSVASFGYGYYSMPALVYIFFFIGLVSAVLHDWQLEGFSKSTRILLSVEFILLFFGTFALRFAIKQSVGSLALSQGRYFIPFIPLLIFSIFGGTLRTKLNDQALRLTSFWAATLTLITVSIAMYLVYYVPCGMYVYSPGKCVLPVYKNWDPSRENSLLIRQDKPLEQVFQPDCGKTDSLSFFTYRSPKNTTEGEFSLQMTNLQTGERLFNLTYPNTIVTDGAMTVLNIPAVRLDTNGKYRIAISTDDSQAIFSIGLSDKQRIRGSLSQAGQSIDKDLLFQYSCVK